jgi:inner membrane protein involved in colicin E2 resistance
MGAVALLAVVAALMYLTRRVDWYVATAAKPA